MKRFTSYDEIETLCEAMIKDFFRSRHYTNSLCVDIEAFVKEYLGLPIVYDTFAEPDPGRVGFFSDGERPLWVRRGNQKEQIVYPARTIVIEKFLLNPRESARKRFTISHEGAHDVLDRHIPIQASPVAAFHSEYDPDMIYTTDMLHEMLSINECFTNRAAACLLMPEFLVKRVLKRHNNSKKVALIILFLFSHGGLNLFGDLQNRLDLSGVTICNQCSELFGVIINRCRSIQPENIISRNLKSFANLCKGDEPDLAVPVFNSADNRGGELRLFRKICLAETFRGSDLTNTRTYCLIELNLILQANTSFKRVTIFYQRSTMKYIHVWLYD